MPVVGYLGSETPEKFGIRVTAFQQGLSAMGYDEGRNVKIEYHWANGQNERLPALAADLVRRQVTVIVTPGSVVCSTCSKGSNQNNSDYFRDRRGPRCSRACEKPEPTGG